MPPNVRWRCESGRRLRADRQRSRNSRFKFRPAFNGCRQFHRRRPLPFGRKRRRRVRPLSVQARHSEPHHGRCGRKPERCALRQPPNVFRCRDRRPNVCSHVARRSCPPGSKWIAGGGVRGTPGCRGKNGGNSNPALLRPFESARGTWQQRAFASRDLRWIEIHCGVGAGRWRRWKR